VLVVWQPRTCACVNGFPSRLTVLCSFWSFLLQPAIRSVLIGGWGEPVGWMSGVWSQSGSLAEAQVFCDVWWTSSWLKAFSDSGIEREGRTPSSEYTLTFTLQNITVTTSPTPCYKNSSTVQHISHFVRSNSDTRVTVWSPRFI